MFRNLSVQPALRGSNGLCVGRKIGEFSIAFSVHGTVGSPTGPDEEIRVDDQEIGSSGRPVSSGLQVPAETEYCRSGT
jgi:hypothetical protein